MTDGLVRTQSPEEREYSRYLIEVDERKQRAAALQEELEFLRVALSKFEAGYHAVVGSLFLELDRVRLAIRSYEMRIALLHDGRGLDAVSVEDKVEETLRSAREDLHEQEHENRQYEQVLERENQRPRLSPDEEAEIHRLFRELAKRFHPDLARTEDERRKREPLMQRVNAAMHDRDLARLRQLFGEAEVSDAAFETRSLGDKLVWAIREVARLDQVIQELEQELASLRSSESHALWQREEYGERVIERLRRELQGNIEEAQRELATLISTYRNLVETRIG